MQFFRYTGNVRERKTTVGNITGYMCTLMKDAQIIPLFDGTSSSNMLEGDEKGFFAKFAAG